MADNLDVNNDKYAGDVNDLSGALSQLADAYNLREASPLEPFGSPLTGSLGDLFSDSKQEQIKKQEALVVQISQKLGLNSDEAKALIESTAIKAQYENKYGSEQKKATDFINAVKNFGTANSNLLGAYKSKEDIIKSNLNNVVKTAQDLNIDISKIDLNSKDTEATKTALLAEINKYYNNDTGKYNTPTVVNPSEEEKKKLQLGTAVEKKVLNLAQGKGTSATNLTNVGVSGTGVDTSIPSSGGSSLNATQNVTLADGTVVPATVNTSSYNSFLNADDPNAYIGITDPSGKTQTIDKNGQVVTGVQATYQYKDVMGDKGWNGMDESSRIAMKKFLYAGNFYGTSDVLNLGSGNITEADVKAMTSAMAASNINGVDVNSYLKPMYEEFLYTGRPFGEKPVDLNGDGKIDAYDQNNVTALKGFFKRNGLEADEAYIASYDKAIRSGATTLDAAQQEIREKMIAPSYAGYSDEIKKGTDLETLASPYKSKISTMLGIDASMIDINDPIMKSILNNKNAEGKPTYTTMEDADKIIRQDPRWRASDKAQGEVVTGMYSLMQRFGIF